MKIYWWNYIMLINDLPVGGSGERTEPKEAESVGSISLPLPASTDISLKEKRTTITNSSHFQSLTLAKRMPWLIVSSIVLGYWKIKEEQDGFTTPILSSPEIIHKRDQCHFSTVITEQNISMKVYTVLEILSSWLVVEEKTRFTWFKTVDFL